MISLLKIPVWTVLLLLIAGSLAGAAEPIPVQYNLKVHLDLDRHTLEGRGEILVNLADRSKVSQIPLGLYPNIHHRRPDQLDDINFYRIYPTEFNRGSMEILSLSINGHPCPLPKSLHRDHPDWIYLQLPPFIRSARLRIKIHYQVHFPEKHGTFGAIGESIQAQGGWYPWIPIYHRGKWLENRPPPRSRYHLEFTSTRPLQLVVNGRFHPLTHRPWKVSTSGPTCSIAATRYFHHYGAKNKWAEIHFLGRTNNRYPGEDLIKTLSEAAEYLGKTLDRPLGKTTVVEVPLRTSLTDHGQNMFFLSDRYYKVFPFFLPDFHRIEAVWEYYFTYFYRRLQGREDPRHLIWVSEILAWWYTRNYVKNKYRGHKFAVQLFEFFSFIPNVDATLKDPKFPFAGNFFGNIYRQLPWPETYLLHQYPATTGRILYTKLEDITTPLAARRLVKQYVDRWKKKKGPLSFLRVMRQYFPDEEKIFRQEWLFRPLAQWDYQLEAVRSPSTTSPQGVPYHLEIRRHGPVGRWEVVKIKVRDIDGNEEIRTVLSNRSHLQIKGFLPRPIDDVIIDPDRRIWEKYRPDNDNIFSIKVLVDKFSARIDLNRGDFEAEVGTSLLFNGNYRHRFVFEAKEEQEFRGGNFDYRYSFGRNLDATSFAQHATGGISFVDLKPDFALNRSGRINDEGQVASWHIEYNFTNVIYQRNPTSGTKFNVDFSMADKIAGGDFRFYSVEGTAVQIVAVAQSHIFAWRLKGGHIWGDPPTQSLFSLGGEEAVRGLKAGEVLGKNYFATVFEYRYTFFTDMDVNLVWLTWLHRLQGVIFIGIGGSHDKIRKIFDRVNTVPEVGAGLRFHFQGFGFRNTVVHFDIARRIDQWRASSFQFYIGANQSF